jgi:hypothetical protein
MRRAIPVAALVAAIGLGVLSPRAEPRPRTFIWLLYCTPWFGCFPGAFYYEEVWVIAQAGRMDVYSDGRWGAITEGCPECELADWPQFDPPNPEPVDGGGSPGCGDERDTIIGEYSSGAMASLFVPTCNDFATGGGSSHFSWGDLNQAPGSGHPPWGIVRSILLNGLELTWFIYGGTIAVTSGYRCPHGNSLVSTASTSRHMWGDAADIKPGTNWNPPNELEFSNLRGAALCAGAGYLTEWSTYTDHHLHADWR